MAHALLAQILAGRPAARLGFLIRLGQICRQALIPAQQLCGRRPWTFRLAEEWRRKAGNTVRTRAKVEARAPDYYSTEDVPGPIRLAKMTLESAFYTRHLWLAVRNWLAVALVAVIGALAIVVMLALAGTTGAGLLVAQVVATAALVAIAVDALSNATLFAICIARVRTPGDWWLRSGW